MNIQAHTHNHTHTHTHTHSHTHTHIQLPKHGRELNILVWGATNKAELRILLDTKV
jgi:hypothetical protein